MRLHRYRAYNKKLKKMMEVLSIELDPEMGGVEVWGKASVDFSTGEHEAARDFWTWDDCEIMQFAGLHARSDKEIYEGDVITFQLIESGKWHTGVVEYRNAQFMVDAASSLSSAMYIEVIGNIYENPKLVRRERDGQTT